MNDPFSIAGVLTNVWFWIVLVGIGVGAGLVLWSPIATSLSTNLKRPRSDDDLAIYQFPRSISTGVGCIVLMASLAAIPWSTWWAALGVIPGGAASLIVALRCRARDRREAPGQIQGIR